MDELDDNALLREYVDRHSEEAFAALVARHVNMVYSVALRHTGDAHRAEEITQAVFVILAQKSRTFGKNVILSGWLHRTARLTSITLIRSELRRARREQEAHAQAMLNETESDVWPRIAPLLDAAMARLNKTDHDAVVLRFFDKRSMSEVGAALGVSEDAATKRVNRAVEKLRWSFIKRGVVVPSVALIAAISVNSVQAAPVTLAKTATTAALTKGALVLSPALALAKGTVKMTWLKVTTMAAVTANAVVSQQKIATHFDFHGRPNGWMTRSNYARVSMLIGVGLPLFLAAIGYSVRFLPINRFTFKIPNRDFWLAPERRGEAYDLLFRFCLWQACLEAVFMLAIHFLVLFANRQTPPHFPTSVALGLGGGVLAIAALQAGLMYQHFKRGAVAP
jgi:RNA polymerase sigma factor (sigma-70 family)